MAQGKKFVPTQDDKRKMLNAYRAGCDDSIVAAFFNVNRDTLFEVRKRDKVLAKDIAEARAFALSSLKKKAFELAMGGNVTAIIWLQKNLDPMNWRDRHEYEFLSQQATAEKTSYRATLGDEADGDKAAPLTSNVVPLPVRARQKSEA